MCVSNLRLRSFINYCFPESGSPYLGYAGQPGQKNFGAEIFRTTRTTVSFSQPFKLKDLDDLQPAGDYILDTDEELIEGLSRLAYRRVATMLHLPSTSRPQSRIELVSVNPAELAAALERDRSGGA